MKVGRKTVVVDGKRPCNLCKETKPVEEFYKRKTGSLTSNCKKCERQIATEWRIANPERALEMKLAKRSKGAAYMRQYRKREDKSKRHRYRLKPDEFAALMSRDTGKCMICADPISGRTLMIDHCHVTLKVRGLLCRRCNTGLGMFRDSPELLLAAVAYLRGAEAKAA